MWDIIFILEGIEIYCTFNRQQLATEGGKVKKKKCVKSWNSIKMSEIGSQVLTQRKKKKAKLMEEGEAIQLGSWPVLTNKSITSLTL